MIQWGTVGEWFGAVASSAAVVVALALAARDDEVRRARRAARRRLHALAEEQLRHFDRWAEGLSQPDGEALTRSSQLDAEAATYRAETDALGARRQRRGRAILTEIYGARAMEVVDLYPDPMEASASVMSRLLAPGSRLAVDGEPGPLRRRGALDITTTDHAQLRAAFAQLARL